MKVVMTQSVCPEGLAMLEGKADIYVADNGDPNNYLDEMERGRRPDRAHREMRWTRYRKQPESESHRTYRRGL